MLRAHIFVKSVGVTSVRAQDRLLYFTKSIGAFSYIQFHGLTCIRLPDLLLYSRISYPLQSFYFPTVYNISKFYEIWRQKKSPASNGIRSHKPCSISQLISRKVKRSQLIKRENQVQNQLTSQVKTADESGTFFCFLIFLKALM